MVSIFSDNNDTEIVNNETKMDRPNFFENMEFAEKLIWVQGMDILKNWNNPDTIKGGKNNRDIIFKLVDLTFGYSSYKKVENTENYQFKFYKNQIELLTDENLINEKIYNVFKIMDQIRKEQSDFFTKWAFVVDWEKNINIHIIANKLRNAKYEYKNNEKLPFVDEIKSEAAVHRDHWDDILDYKNYSCPFSKKEIEQIRKRVNEVYNYKYKYNYDFDQLLEKVEEKKQNINLTYDYKNKTKYDLSEIIQNVKQNAIALLTVDKHALPHLPFINEIVDENLELFCVHVEEKEKEEICYTIAPYPFLDEIKKNKNNNENEKWWKKNIIIFLLFTAPFIWKINNW